MNLWITGYRSYELGIFNTNDKKINVIKYALERRIIEKFDEGLEWIITGAQMGVEEWACEVVFKLKLEYPELKIAIMTPYEEFASGWKENNQIQFNERRQQADFVGSVSKEKYKNPIQLKNYLNFMLAHTDQALLIYDEEYEGKTKYAYEIIKRYAEKQEYPYELIDMYQLQDFAQDYQSND